MAQKHMCDNKTWNIRDWKRKNNDGVRDDIHIKSEWMKDMSVNDCELKWRKHYYILW